MDLKNFEQLGLNQTEIKILKCIFEFGTISPALVAKQTGLKRPTVYAGAEGLIESGFIREDISGKNIRYTALYETGFKNYLISQKRKLAEKEALITELANTLEKTPRPRGYNIPKVTRIEGKEEILDFLYTQTPVWNESIIKTHAHTWWGFQDHIFVEDKEYRKWIKWYWNTAPEKIDLNLFSNDSEIEKTREVQTIDRRRHIKFWKGDKITATEWIVGEYIITIVLDGTHHTLIETRDQILAENLRNVFKFAWSAVS